MAPTVTRTAEADAAPLADSIFGSAPRRDSPFIGRLMHAVTEGAPPSALDDVTRNDLTLVLEFALSEGSRLRHDFSANRWFVFDYNGHTFGHDRDGEALRCLGGYLQTRLQEAALIGRQQDRAPVVKYLLSALKAGRIERLLELAGHQRPIATAGDDWDLDPWLLGNANCVVELRTGASRAGTPADRITRSTGILVDQDAKCPRWQQFLQQVLPDEDTRRFLHRAVGYTLTGQITEQVFFLLIGPGSNGKSVLLAVLRLLLGQYAATVPFGSLTRRREHGDESPSSDLAALPGVRIVSASEVKDGACFDEARVKAITGGDPLTCRHLYGRWFSFAPVFKLWMAVNHLPRVRDDSHAFWRRVRLIPFREVFDGSARDDRLLEKLTAELPGILNWAIEGCLAWQDFGLPQPSEMSTEAENWRTENDPLADFLATDRLDFHDSGKTPSAELHAAYLAWAAGEGIPEAQRLSRIAFGRRVSSKLASVKRDGRTVFIGVRVR